MRPPGWGEVANSDRHARYLYPKPKGSGGARKCKHGSPMCGNRNTHFGAANGVCLTSGCEWHMRMWAKRGWT